MQHEQADQTLAVERYLLGDMTPTELEQFEEHLFICPECADSVKAGVAFVDNARVVLAEPAFQTSREAARSKEQGAASSWWKWFLTPAFAPAFAALAFICVAGYQQFVVIRGLRTQLAEVTTPQPLATFALHAVSRGEPQAVVVPADARFYSLYFDVAAESASGYSCGILDGSGSVRFTEHLAAPKPEAGGSLNLLIGHSALPPGEYVLVVNAESPRPTEIGRYPFKVKFP